MKNWSLNAKIYLAMGFLVFGIGAVAANGLYQMNIINEILKDISVVQVNKVHKTQKLLEMFFLQLSVEKNYVVNIEDGAFKVAQESIDKRDKELRAILTEGKTILKGKELEDLLEFEKIYSKWYQFDQQVEELAREKKTKEAAALIEHNGRAIRKAAEATLEGLNIRVLADVKERAADAESDYNEAKIFFILSSLLTIAIGLGFATLILKSLSRSMNSIIENLSENFQHVTSASGQIAASSEELSAAATEQSASLEETAASIQEMSTMVQKNSDNAKKASETALLGRESASKGKLVVDNMIVAINDINLSNTDIMKQVNHSNAEISKIVGVIAEIGKKTKIINEIVFQTKLLSFNASVEAARAGEHGKGFAVVAEEVGKLAQVSGNAAEEISKMLDESIRQVEGIVKNTTDQVEILIGKGREKIESGTKVAHDCGDVLEEIVQRVSEVTSMTDEIALASEEQSKGVLEITKAMNVLGQVTHTNAASSTQAAEAAESLSNQANSLRLAVDTLVVTVKGGDVPQNKAEGSVHQLTPVKAAKTSFKRVSGDSFLPGHNDSRFEEV